MSCTDKQPASAPGCHYPEPFSQHAQSWSDQHLGTFLHDDVAWRDPPRVPIHAFFPHMQMAFARSSTSAMWMVRTMSPAGSRKKVDLFERPPWTFLSVIEQPPLAAPQFI